VLWYNTRVWNVHAETYNIDELLKSVGFELFGHNEFGIECKPFVFRGCRYVRGV